MPGAPTKAPCAAGGTDRRATQPHSAGHVTRSGYEWDLNLATD